MPRAMSVVLSSGARAVEWCTATSSTVATKARCRLVRMLRDINLANAIPKEQSQIDETKGFTGLLCKLPKSAGSLG